MAAGVVDRDVLLADLGALVAVHLDRPLGDLRVGDLLLDVMGTMRRNHLRLPVDLALLAKTFVMSEGLAARLDPEFHMAPAVLAHLAAPSTGPATDPPTGPATDPAADPSADPPADLTHRVRRAYLSGP
jgi:predicted unusual protein kinase regulating ubiquinone biosynthesis (AarF/ABC1/UbiB family)